MDGFTYRQKQVLHAAGEVLIDDIQKLHNAVLHLSSLLLEKGIISQEEWEQGAMLPEGTALKELQKMVVHPVVEKYRRVINDGAGE
jgi:hypothetical protein